MLSFYSMFRLYSTFKLNLKVLTLNEISLSETKLGWNFIILKKLKLS